MLFNCIGKVLPQLNKKTLLSPDFIAESPRFIPVAFCPTHSVTAPNCVPEDHIIVLLRSTKKTTLAAIYHFQLIHISPDVRQFYSIQLEWKITTCIHCFGR